MNRFRIVYLAAAVLFAARAGAWTLSLNPYLVEAGKPATVSASGMSNYCSPIVSHRKAAVDGHVITLTGGWSNDPLARCVAGPTGYEVDFDLPALTPGQYTVVNRIQPECAYSSTPCPFAFLADSGSLDAKSPDSLAYHIKPKSVQEKTPFKLQVLASEFTCGSAFNAVSADVVGHRIGVRFSHEAHPEAVCPAVLADYGPTFGLPALDAGAYQVIVYRILPCPFKPCLADLVIIPQLAGQLTVDGSATGIGLLDPTPLKAKGLERGATASPRVIWRGEARDLSGRVPPGR